MPALRAPCSMLLALALAVPALAATDTVYPAPPKRATRTVTAFEVRLEPRDAGGSATVALLVVGDGGIDCGFWGEALCARLVARQTWRVPKGNDAPNTCVVLRDSDPTRGGYAQLLPFGAMHLARREATWHGTLFAGASVAYQLAFVVEGEAVSGTALWRSEDPEKSYRRPLTGRVLRSVELGECVARAADAVAGYLRATD